MSKARQIYEDLGVVPVINASGYQTVIGGSRVGTEVQAAMDIANRYFADMEELLKKTGAIIADTLGAEAAMVHTRMRGSISPQHSRLHVGQRPRENGTIARYNGLEASHFNPKKNSAITTTRYSPFSVPNS